VSADPRGVVKVAVGLLDHIARQPAPFPIRLFGSVAVAVACPECYYLSDVLGRNSLTDIDLVTHEKYEGLACEALRDYGLVEPANFRELRDEYRRPIYVSPDGSYEAEIHFDPLNFHHIIELGDRLALRPHTIPATELALSKLQYEEPSRDQLIDLVILFASRACGNEEGDTISVTRISSLARADWALWKTVDDNLSRLRKFTEEELQLPSEGGSFSRVVVLVDCIRDAMARSEKTLRWRVTSAVHRIFPFLPRGQTVDTI